MVTSQAELDNGVARPQSEVSRGSKTARHTPTAAGGLTGEASDDTSAPDCDQLSGLGEW